ncbi:SRPBCC family protein [Chitinophaga nivalis]|uniref:SRPBCC family protein n=1 Tax=Chitinophaga nivalis TaxID=2991709 RepID=A0ABT3IVX4_9BACT|nr:SRPBCC family protein [Chitinophaga nivalis]MCW3462262.1 SRPBCC family protein [Chitinophaga nivalis]MCW3488046.1 SRPBCC family protein [Chitinophaga nivalis]
MASIYSLQQIQLIPATLEEVWHFFATANNLARLTPAYMRFRVTSAPYHGHIYAGQFITYLVSPVPGIPLEWVTEITQVQPLSYFVDEQRVGPYRMWHHQHHFEAVPGGVRMTDTVHYRLPLGVLGKLAHYLWVKRQLDGIFSYRKTAVEQHFGRM